MLIDRFKTIYEDVKRVGKAAVTEDSALLMGDPAMKSGFLLPHVKAGKVNGGMTLAAMVRTLADGAEEILSVSNAPARIGPDKVRIIHNLAPFELAAFQAYNRAHRRKVLWVEEETGGDARAYAVMFNPKHVRIFEMMWDKSLDRFISITPYASDMEFGKPIETSRVMPFDPLGSFADYARAEGMLQFGRSTLDPEICEMMTREVPFIGQVIVSRGFASSREEQIASPDGGPPRIGLRMGRDPEHDAKRRANGAPTWDEHPLGLALN